MVAGRTGLVAGHEAQALEAEIKRGRERSKMKGQERKETLGRRGCGKGTFIVV